MKRRGFTMVELMVVIAIMAILLTLGVVNLRSSQANGNDAERKADIESIAAHLETYYKTGTNGTTSFGTYPSTALVSSGVGYISQLLRDIDVKSITAPGIDDPTLTFIPATDGLILNNNSPHPTKDEYVYQPLKNDGTLCNPSVSTSGNIEVLVVGGGGGGGQRVGGGGGGGGVFYSNVLNVTTSPKTIVVGGGGAGAIANNVLAGNGANSIFDSTGGSSTKITAYGGGGGNSYNRVGTGASGGSGGGGSFANPGGSQAGGSANPGDAGSTGSIGYANIGGTSYSATLFGGGGGGGAGTVGLNATSNVAGNGGIGVLKNISGANVYYGGGGGGGASGGTGGLGGLGGGGNGKAAASGLKGDWGTVNTGGGGGGGSDNTGGGSGGTGGSGIVIIRYLTGSIRATGGDTVTYYNGYTIHTFLNNGTFTVSSVTAPECRKFNLYYRSESDNVVHMLTSKNQ